MAIKYLNNIDLATNELQHAVIQPLISPPTDLTAKLGQVYYNTLDDKLKIYTSVGWVTVGGVSSITSGNINTITIGGTIFNPTVSANTAPVTSGSLNLVTGDDVYNFISVFGYVPSTRQLSINGTQYDLSVDRSWSVGTVTSVSFTLGTSGTDLNSSIVNSTTTPAITLNVPTASASHRGALSATDWSTFNAKQSTLTLGNLTSTDITVTGGTASIIGAGSTLTLATVNSNVGTFGSSTAIPVITVNGKGLITTLTTTTVSIPSGALSFIGDVTGSGTTGSNTTLTLAIVNTNVGTYGSSTSVPTITVNAKGLVTAASQTAIPSATSSITGLLTSTDWVIFNSKLTRNTAITGATKTKISYDINGLVTNGEDATTADIADSTNKRYVTDANLIVINNTSNTNTGDQGLQSVTDINAITTKTITAAGLKTSTGTGANIFLDDGTTTPLKFQSDIVVSLSSGKTLGKYTTGQTIPSAGKTFEQVMNDIAIEYLLPSITSFSISGQSTTVESGTVISGTKSFTFNVSQPSNVNSNSLIIYQQGSPLASYIPVTSPSTWSIGTINTSGNGTSYSFYATAVNTQSTVFTSNTYTITSRYNQFYGNVTTTPTTSANVRALTNNNFANVNSWVTPVISTTKFALSIPATKLLTNAITANFENITSSFSLNTFNVNDAGGNAISYKTYTYTSSVPLDLTITITVS